MPKRRLYWLCGITLVFLAGGVSVLGAVVKHEPNFYSQCRISPGKARKDLALDCFSRFANMKAAKENLEEVWGCDASEAHLNSFFEEIWQDRSEAEGLRNLGISSPRVVLEKDHVRLAFRYGSGWFSTVISYDLKIWLVPKEANVIAVEIQSARAGGLPISNHSILHQLTEFARKQNYKVTLYRHEGNTVAIIDLQGDQQHPSGVITTLDIDTNRVTIRGRTLEHARRPLVINQAKKAP
jgi:hypothetical protein